MNHPVTTSTRRSSGLEHMTDTCARMATNNVVPVCGQAFVCVVFALINLAHGMCEEQRYLFA